MKVMGTIHLFSRHIVPITFISPNYLPNPHNGLLSEKCE